MGCRQPPDESAVLTLGPVLFNWQPEIWRDFYFRIADAAPVDIVYVGEVVCAKRLPFFAPYLPEVVARLQSAGKQVIFSTLALTTTNRELESVRELASDASWLIEANDISAVSVLAGRRHVVGPYVNAYNEETIRTLAGLGAVRVALNAELPGSAVRLLVAAGTPLEIQVYGRVPLAISARCYHARAEQLHKDGCRFVCERDPDGLDVFTIDNQPFLAVNGLQTLSHSCINLAQHVPELLGAGIRHFRLSPQTIDMVAVAGLFRDLLDNRMAAEEVSHKLPRPGENVAFSDGFYRGVAGASTLRSEAN
jgi:collagenase-like PrtC family protease